MPALAEIREQSLDSEEDIIDIENMVQERIRNDLRQEFQNEEDFESFMKINEKEIKKITDYISKKIR